MSEQRKAITAKLLARAQAFDAEISTLTAPISDELKADLARRYNDLRVEVDNLNGETFVNDCRN
jgi:hypothetical protein